MHPCRTRCDPVARASPTSSSFPSKGLPHGGASACAGSGWGACLGVARFAPGQAQQHHEDPMLHARVTPSSDSGPSPGDRPGAQRDLRRGKSLELIWAPLHWKARRAARGIQGSVGCQTRQAGGKKMGCMDPPQDECWGNDSHETRRAHGWHGVMHGCHLVSPHMALRSTATAGSTRLAKRGMNCGRAGSPDVCPAQQEGSC